MSEDIKKGAFDKLVAGLSAEDRNSMLERINQNAAPSVQFVEMEEKPDEYSMTLKVRLENESVFYKFFLWLRGLIHKKETEQIYNEDIIAGIARKINREHPGLLMHRHGVLDSVFFERLRGLKECSDFFKPYLLLIDDNPGDFYVFLSSFIAPELSDRITEQADPFILSFGQDPSIEVKSGLLKKLDEVLKEMDTHTKANLYAGVRAVNWLKTFTQLPFIHFSSQFTNITGDSYTCPYTHAKMDFNEFAAVFGNIQTIDNEVLEAIFLFSQRKELTKNAQDKDIERAIKEFLAKANGFLGTIEMFIAGVPVLKIGKVINSSYDWEPASIPGAEAWFPSFRNQWRKIFDIRWNDWIKERKKKMLASNLNTDFKLAEFPVMRYRPWAYMWTHIPFSCELTGGFLNWFALEKFEEVIPTLNEVMMEGIFIRSENRTEFSDGLDSFVKANNKMLELTGLLSPEGEYGQTFQEIIESKVRTLQVQNQIDKIIHETEATVREVTKDFGKGARTIEMVFHGIFDEKKDGLHEGLQNINTIKGRQNREWRDKVVKVRELLKKSIFYISELEPIDSAPSNG